ncbi:MAG: GTP-binding protein [Desulfovibrio sp.]|jgi:small GTP-binding protein|nr:GTP-binding protein [Desulfovibrio sp.]
MITKKICMLGAFAVGKTALVQRYVHSIFSDRYLSTVGVKISKKNVTLDNQEISLVLWDLEGKDTYTEVNISYLRGAMGFFIVADGTRRDTLDTALNLRTLALNLTGPVPHSLLLNKADLAPAWEVTTEDLAALREGGLPIFETSAKTGLGVEEAFAALARDML